MPYLKHPSFSGHSDCAALENTGVTPASEIRNFILFLIYVGSSNDWFSTETLFAIFPLNLATRSAALKAARKRQLSDITRSANPRDTRTASKPYWGRSSAHSAAGCLFDSLPPSGTDPNSQRCKSLGHRHTSRGAVEDLLMSLQRNFSNALKRPPALAADQPGFVG